MSINPLELHGDLPDELKWTLGIRARGPLLVSC